MIIPLYLPGGTNNSRMDSYTNFWLRHGVRYVPCTKLIYLPFPYLVMYVKVYNLSGISLRPLVSKGTKVPLTFSNFKTDPTQSNLSDM